MTIRDLTLDDRAALARFTCARIGQPWTELVQSVVRNELANQLEKGHVSAVGLFDDAGGLLGVAAWRVHDTMSPVLCRGDIVAVAVGHSAEVTAEPSRRRWCLALELAVPGSSRRSSTDRTLR